jgi:UDP-N-acetylglucosamine--N-acetylmuramyl-(pentapeptide) pyrophosphoryl-undecaprenol N-acetylglucosamine transferase
LQKIYASVFGSGLGHVTRVHSIEERLSSDLDISFLYSSFDEAFDYLKNQGKRVIYAPPISLEWTVGGGISGMNTIIKFPRALSDFSRQVEFEDRAISKYDPELVISDSRLSALFGAKRARKRVITILNQVKILFPPRFRKTIVSKILEGYEAETLGLLWNLSDEILFPDLPPPYTIGEANISNIGSAERVKYIGFMMQRSKFSDNHLERIKSSLGIDHRPTIFIQISGPNASKRAFLDSSVDCARKLTEKYNVVISKGLPTGSSSPEKIFRGGWIFDWCPIKNELFSLADVLVARSGHTTIGQCINSGTPAVLVPIFNHSEQIWNALKFVRLGLGQFIRSENLNTMNLEEAIVSCLEDSRYRESAEKLQRISMPLDGIERASEIVRAYV